MQHTPFVCEVIQRLKDIRDNILHNEQYQVSPDAPQWVKDLVTNLVGNDGEIGRLFVFLMADATLRAFEDDQQPPWEVGHDTWHWALHYIRLELDAFMIDPIMPLKWVKQVSNSLDFVSRACYDFGHEDTALAEAIVDYAHYIHYRIFSERRGRRRAHPAGCLLCNYDILPDG